MISICLIFLLLPFVLENSGTSGSLSASNKSSASEGDLEKQTSLDRRNREYLVKLLLQLVPRVAPVSSGSGSKEEIDGLPFPIWKLNATHYEQWNG